ncbi:MAG: tRNA lysidine(34) synthetase TilS, partial [Candidatus Omnitrophica bacterium]|nr:tRNA lysidine(34) synthetase TilS [Candidatus Omnitrophota bacterium]
MPQTKPPHIYEIEKRVLGFVRTHNLFESGERVTVAVSGGSDSMALLSLMRGLCDTYSLQLCAAHVNHGLRGTADADALWVREQCGKLRVPFEERRVRTADLAEEPGVSLEAAAREVRLQALAQMAGEFGAAKVALAHTRDDQAETVLMRLLRGAGPTGLQ